MSDLQSKMACARSGKARLDMLPRDPEQAYVYWEWPGGQERGDCGQLTVYVEGPDGEERQVQSMEVDQECGGRFVAFAQPGAVHRCRLLWGDEHIDSASLRAPRRQSGTDSAAFVRVKMTDDGLSVVPTDHEHGSHGTFSAATTAAPSSGPLDR